MFISGVDDINNPPASAIIETGIDPTGLPSIGGNRALVLQLLPGNSTFSAQLAFGFSSDRIAFRRKTNSTSWTNWVYFTPTA